MFILLIHIVHKVMPRRRWQITFHLTNFFWIKPLTNESLLLVGIVVLDSPNIIEFVQDEGRPPPHFPSLNAFSKFMLNTIASLKEAKNALFGIKDWFDRIPSTQ